MSVASVEKVDTEQSDLDNLAQLERTEMDELRAEVAAQEEALGEHDDQVARTLAELGRMKDSLEAELSEIRGSRPSEYKNTEASEWHRKEYEELEALKRQLMLYNTPASFDDDVEGPSAAAADEDGIPNALEDIARMDAELDEMMAGMQMQMKSVKTKLSQAQRDKQALVEEMAFYEYED
mmetsp:Transcript_24808/g.58607  ORF Transcript_24808/g.58607 Transcript_24808/m.58607 type:complete len:180 (-) Transcript_24808:18-557(-)